MKQEGKYYLFQGTDIQTITREPDLAVNASWYGSLVYHWRASGTRIPFFPDQFQRMKLIQELLGIQLIGWENEQNIKNKLIALIQKNRFFKGVTLHIIIHPISKESSVAINQIRCTEHGQEQFMLNEKGLILEINPDRYPGEKEICLIQGSPFRDSLNDKDLLTQDAEEWIYQDQSGHLLESIHSRIYLVKGDKVFTPKHMELSYWGIESQITTFLSRMDKQLIESSSLHSTHLEQADEVFLADDYHGVRWAMGFRNKRYFRKLSNKLIDLINEDWQKVD